MKYSKMVTMLLLTSSPMLVSTAHAIVTMSPRKLQSRNSLAEEAWYVQA